MSITEIAPTREEHLRLYTAAIHFKKLAPWQWMDDSQLFGVRDPETGEIGYCCVMGILGEVLALGLYTGGRGLHSFLLVRDDDVSNDSGSDDPMEFLATQKLLMLSFEDRDGLTEDDRKILRGLGLKFRGSQEWPMGRSYRPGFQPWFLSGPEARFLATALEQAVEVSKRCRDDEELLQHANAGTYLVRSFSEGLAGREWKDEWITPKREPPAPLKPPPVQLDVVAGLRKTASRLSTSWEIDCFFMPGAIRESTYDRPTLAVLFLIVEARDGMIVTGEPILYPDRETEVSRAFQKAVTAYGLPAEVKVVRDELFALLQPLCAALDIKITRVKALQALSEARDAMQSMMELGF